MKNKRIITILAAIVMTAAMLLSACGSKEATLESYVNDNEEIKTGIEEAIGAQDAKGMTVDIKGNEIVYTYDLSAVDGFTEENASSEEIKGVLEQGLTEHAEDFKGIAKEMSEKTEIKGVKVTVNYTFGDKTIVSQTFEPDQE